MIVYTASDHAGFNLRTTLVERLRSQGHAIVDLGTDSESACDYPEFASAVANSVRSTPGSLGILVCATGQGMAIAAGKVRGIRAVVPANVEAARLSRFDNDANVLCLAGRLKSEGDAFAIVDTWLATSFAGGRHARRIAKVAAIETASAVAFVTEGERLGLASRGIPGRLFDRDPALFADTTADQASVAQSLAWIALPSRMAESAAELVALASEVRQERFKHLLLVVPDANTSAIAAISRLWAFAANGLRLQVIDRDPATVTAPGSPVDLKSALVLVAASAQAGQNVQTIEQQLWTRMLDLSNGDAECAGKHFVAVVPTPSVFEDRARMHCYRAIFSGPAGVAESFAALGHPGLVPAALLGMDVGRLLARTQSMIDACRVDRLDANPGVSLGVLIGALAKHGRKKLTLLLSKSLTPLGGWIADVMASANDADFRRITTVWNEELQSSYPPDRVFVHVQAADDVPAIPPDAMEALHLAGQPYIQIAVHDKYDLGGEVFRWQVAATVTALVQRPA